MSKNDSKNNAEGEDTTRTDLLMTILQELRDLRIELERRDEDLDQRIDRLEHQVEIIRSAQESHGLKLAQLEAQCAKRLDSCQKSRRSDSNPTPIRAWIPGGNHER